MALACRNVREFRENRTTNHHCMESHSASSTSVAFSVADTISVLAHNPLEEDLEEQLHFRELHYYQLRKKITSFINSTDYIYLRRIEIPSWELTAGTGSPEEQDDGPAGAADESELNGAGTVGVSASSTITGLLLLVRP